MTEIIFLSAAVILLIFYLNFLRTIYKGLNKLSDQTSGGSGEFVSVIIPFRNEEENILNSLRSLECQDYPRDKYEIIYVNDNSEDDGPALLKKNIHDENITMINSPTNDSSKGGKKSAINCGIKNSKGEIIVTTDADCIHQPGWLRSLIKYFDDETAMAAGPVDIEINNDFWQKIQRLEFAGLITAGAGLIGAGNPVICNGANLAYRKSIFYKLGGFDDNLDLASGDDELLMQKIKRETSYSIKFSGSRDTVVKTKMNSSFTEFFHQRKRWASKTFFYKDTKIFLKLLMIFLFYAGLAVQFIAGFYNPVFWISFLASFGMKIYSEYLIMKKAARLLFDDSILTHFLLTEILHIPYILISSAAGVLGGFNWKNRRIKR